MEYRSIRPRAEDIAKRVWNTVGPAPRLSVSGPDAKTNRRSSQRHDERRDVENGNARPFTHAYQSASADTGQNSNVSVIAVASGWAAQGGP